MRQLKGFVRRALDALRNERDADWYRVRGADIGERVYIGRSSALDMGFLQLISIGDDTTISSRVEILAHDAAMKHSIGHTVIARTTIGARVYVGAGSIILPGITIGDGAVVGAGSVVTKDVPAGMVVAGNPARVIRPVEDLAERHRQLRDGQPTYPSRGWTTWDGGISDQRKAEMREALSDGPGYIE